MFHRLAPPLRCGAAWAARRLLKPVRSLGSKSEVEFAIKREEVFVDAAAAGSGSNIRWAGQSAACASSMVLKVPAARKAKIAEPRLVMSLRRNQDGFVEDAGVDPVQRFVLLRDASGVDDAMDGAAVFFHPFQDDAGVKRRAFDGREQIVLSGVRQVPAQGDAAEFGIDQNGAVAVIPGEAKETGLAGFECIEVGDNAATVVPARRGDGIEDIAGGGEPASIPVMRGCTEPGRRRRLPESGGCRATWR